MTLVKRGAFALLLLSFLATARCYNTDFAAALGGMPLVGSIVSPAPPTPAYIASIGTPAPAESLPETDVDLWFPAADSAEQSTLPGARQWLVAAQTQLGWTAFCGMVGDVAGRDRDAEDSRLSALACSVDPTVTRLQQFAALVLLLDPELEQYLAGTPGSSRADFESTLARIRVECAAGFASRLRDTPAVAQACALPAMSGTAGVTVPELLTAAEAAYSALATEVVARDPDADDAPSFFEPAQDQ